jgi:hypothetical protein
MENYKNKDIYIDKVAAVAELASECFFHGNNYFSTIVSFSVNLNVH